MCHVFSGIFQLIFLHFFQIGNVGFFLSHTSNVEQSHCTLIPCSKTGGKNGKHESVSDSSNICAVSNNRDTIYSISRPSFHFLFFYHVFTRVRLILKINRSYCSLWEVFLLGRLQPPFRVTRIQILYDFVQKPQKPRKSTSILVW